MITDINQLDLNKKYTYADYMTWQFEERVELIKGKVFKKAPFPGEEHQRVSSNLTVQLGLFLREKKKKWQVRYAPYDVRLPIWEGKSISEEKTRSVEDLSDEKIETVVQPDIVVICDPSKIDQRGCKGVPDLVVEILSEGNNQVELIEKYALYESAGVPEHWIIHPYGQSLTIYTLNEQNKYTGSKPFGSEETIRSNILEGLEIELEKIFK